MATIAENLLKLQNTKTAIKSAIEAKGVAVGSVPFAQYADKISAISGGGEKQIGVDLGLFFEVSNQTILPSSKAYTVDLTGITTIGPNAMAYLFQNKANVVGAKLQDVRQVDDYGLDHAFTGTALTEFSIGAEEIGKYGAQFVCADTPTITNINLSAVRTVAQSGLSHAFDGCKELYGDIMFNNLESLGALSMAGALLISSLSEDKIDSLWFPKLVTVGKNSFGGTTSNYMLRYRTNIKEIHFRADAQPAIEAMTGYDTQWGATNATIYFDL